MKTRLMCPASSDQSLLLGRGKCWQPATLGLRFRGIVSLGWRSVKRREFALLQAKRQDLGDRSEPYLVTAPPGRACRKVTMRLSGRSRERKIRQIAKFGIGRLCAEAAPSCRAARKVDRVALSDIDRQLLQRCLARQPHAWEDFVDRFLGLVVHVVHHTTSVRSLAILEHDLEDLASEVFIAILAEDYAVLRRFRGQSSLATYLTVIARRVVVKELLKRRIVPGGTPTGELQDVEDHGSGAEERMENADEVHRLLAELEPEEAEIVRLYHLDGKSYHEISRETGVPENSIGPALSRARAKMRRASADAATSR
jgi:RNA polymerase sigma-70 factor (ECF subfamily)